METTKNHVLFKGINKHYFLLAKDDLRFSINNDTLRFFVRKPEMVDRLKELVKIGELFYFTIKYRQYVGRPNSITFINDNTECVIRFFGKVYQKTKTKDIKKPKFED